MQVPDNQKLRSKIHDWYKAMHAERQFLGRAFEQHHRSVNELIQGAVNLKVLDFGCGPKGGLKSLQGFPHQVTSYDPYIKEYASDPWKSDYDLIFSSDVMEHLLLPQVFNFCDKVSEKLVRFVFLVIATRAATKSFPNGLNVHLIVEPATWWQGFLQARLRGHTLQIVREDHVEGVVEFGFTLNDE